MKWFTGLRALVYLRRLTIAMERIADNTDAAVQIAQDLWADKRVKPTPRPIEIGTMDAEEVGRRWRREREEAMMDLEPDL